MRLLAGILAGQAFDSELVGDASLMRRPMERVAAPLRLMGASDTDAGRLAAAVDRGRPGAARLRTCARNPERTGQVGAAARGALCRGADARVSEPGISRDHTERMLEAFGVSVASTDTSAGIAGPATLTATRIDVPGDFSSAAFFIVAGLLAGSAPLRIRDVGINPTRTALIDILRLMGADIRLHAASRPRRGEPRADIEVRPSRLRGIVVPPALVPIALDELPILFAAAAVAEGETVVTGAAELRVKESDRLAAMADGLESVGVALERLPDGLLVHGGPVSGGVVASRGDHRVAMSFAVLGARARSPIAIRDVQNVATSFPGFAATARAAGLRLEEAG